MSAPTPALEHCQARLQALDPAADPVRFAYLQALARRGERLGGRARQQVAARLDQALDGYPARAVPVAVAAPAAAGPLHALTALLDQAAAARQAAAPVSAAPALSGSGAGAAAMPVLEEFRELCHQLRSQGQVRRTLEQAPVGAGPLNSTALAHRAITTMQAISPGYLQQFLAYLDTLSWLEQLYERSSPAAATPRGAVPRKPAKPRARTRKPRPDPAGNA